MSTLVELAGDTLAVVIALVGWYLHIRTCRATTEMLNEENRRLTDILARVTERSMNHQADRPGGRPGSGQEWRPAP